MKYLFIAFAMLFTVPVIAQYQKESSTQDVFRATILAPGLSFEKKVTRTSTLYAHAHLNFSFQFNYSSNMGSETKVYFDPAVVGQYRFYYNGDKRFAKGSRTEMNSMEYIAPAYQAVFTKRRISSEHYEETSRRPINSVGAVWGLQRNLPNRLSIDVNIGPGVMFTKTTRPDDFSNPVVANATRFTILGQLTFGIWLNKKPA